MIVAEPCDHAGFVDPAGAPSEGVVGGQLGQLECLVGGLGRRTAICRFRASYVSVVVHPRRSKGPFRIELRRLGQPRAGTDATSGRPSQTDRKVNQNNPKALRLPIAMRAVV
jgi:hypothetical protein